MNERRLQVGFPKSYGAAAALLHDRRRQRLRLHDEIDLKFCLGGLGVYSVGLKIVMFDERGKHIRVKAAQGRKRANERVISHINRFLPDGCHARLDCGRMIVEFAGGPLVMEDVVTIRVG